jgi:hypothetical protein
MQSQAQFFEYILIQMAGGEYDIRNSELSEVSEDVHIIIIQWIHHETFI